MIWYLYLLRLENKDLTCLRHSLTSAPPSFLALTFSSLSLQPLPKPTLISLSLQSSPTFLRFVFSFRIGAVQDKRGLCLEEWCVWALHMLQTG
ncbi:unnamed protein product [Citrullus colocynthis]|uniref:Uncharacterized protein n=1 Tax=Citrullus colocynthis TaxID=252529 RepID=A0ABP0Y670_9ROSI